MISDNESLAFEEEDGGSVQQQDLAIPGPAARTNSSVNKGGKAAGIANITRRPPLHTPVTANQAGSSEAAEGRDIGGVKRSLQSALTQEVGDEGKPTSTMLSRIVKRTRDDSIASNASSIMFQDASPAAQSGNSPPPALASQPRKFNNDSIVFSVADDRPVSPPLVPQTRSKMYNRRSSPEQSISFQSEASPNPPARPARIPVAVSNDSIAFQSLDPVRRSPVPFTNDSIAFQIEGKGRQTPVGVTNDSIAFQFDEAEDKLNATDNNLDAGKKAGAKVDKNSSPGASMTFMPLTDNMPSVANDSIAFQIDEGGSPDNTLSNGISQKDLAKYRRSASTGSRRHGNRPTPLDSDGRRRSPEAELHIALESSAELNNTVGSSESNRDNNELLALLGKPPTLLQTKSLHIDDPITFSGTHEHEDDGLSPGAFSSTRMISGSKNSSSSDPGQTEKAGSPHRKAAKKTIVSNHLKNNSRSSSAVKPSRHAMLAQAASRLKEAGAGRLFKNEDGTAVVTDKTPAATMPPQVPTSTAPQSQPPINMPKKKSENAAPPLIHIYSGMSSVSSQDYEPPQRQYTEREVSTNPPAHTDLTHTPRENRSDSGSVVLQHLEDQESQNQFHQRELIRRKSASVRAEQAGGGGGRSTPSYGSPVHKHVLTMTFDGSDGNSGAMSPLELSQAQKTKRAVKHNAALAGEETKYWQVFNDQQRKELQQLTGVIAAAKRQDRSVLERSRQEQSGAPAAAAVREDSPRSKVAKAGGYAATLCQLKYSAPAARAEVPHPYPRQRKPSPKITVSQKSTPRPTSAKPTAGRPKGRRTGKAADAFPSHAHPHERDTRQQSPPPAAPKTVDAASVAALLGIQWPPAAPRQLYFVNGTRLTPAQTAKFNEMVQVEAAAAKTQQQYENHRLEQHMRNKERRVLSPSKLREPSAPSGASPLDQLYANCEIKPKQTNAQHNKGAKRSQTLREVFDFLDVSGSHVLRAVDLPVLKNLLEDEIACLEPLTKGEGLDEGKRNQRGGPSDTLYRRRGSLQEQLTLLQEARACQSLHRRAWNQVSRARSSSSARHDSEALEWEDEVQTVERKKEVKQAQAVRKALLHAFIVNIVIPLLLTSCINEFDFSTFCVILFASINGHKVGISEEGKAWRQIVSQYFEVLGS